MAIFNIICSFITEIWKFCAGLVGFPIKESSNLKKIAKIKAQKRKSLWLLSIQNTMRKKFLILDLDETLVHSSPKWIPGFTYTVDIYIENTHCTFFVCERPHLHEFMQVVSDWFDVIIFTASVRSYADYIIDRVDRLHKLSGRYYRDHCKVIGGEYVKDLSVLKKDLADCIMVDNSEASFLTHPENAVPISPWFGGHNNDDELLNLLEFLDVLRRMKDCRSLLGLRVKL